MEEEENEYLNYGSEYLFNNQQNENLYNSVRTSKDMNRTFPPRDYIYQGYENPTLGESRKVVRC